MNSTEILLCLSDSGVSNSAASSFPAGVFFFFCTYLHIFTNTIARLERNMQGFKSAEVFLQGSWATYRCSRNTFATVLTTDRNCFQRSSFLSRKLMKALKKMHQRKNLLHDMPDGRQGNSKITSLCVLSSCWGHKADMTEGPRQSGIRIHSYIFEK